MDGTEPRTFSHVYSYHMNKLNQSQVEIGDGATSRVYIGDIWFSGKLVALKQLKCYLPRLAPSLVKSYEPLLNSTMQTW